MTRESTAPKPTQQAHLKLEGQKLLKMDDSGGLLSNFGGLPVAAKLAEETGLIRMAAGAIPEWRIPELVDFEIEELLAQRLFLTASGHSDAIDCSFWKDDPALKTALRKAPDGPSLSSQSTQTRMEQSITPETIKDLEAVPLKFFFEQKKHAPHHLSIYIDGSAIKTFGAQQNSTFRGGKKYGQTQYFPLIATTDCGWLLLAQLRKGGAADAHAVPSIQSLVLDIKAQWKSTTINLAMDTGFNSPELLDFLDEEKVEYTCGYPVTSSVLSKVQDVLCEVEVEFRKLYGKPKYTGPKSEADDLWQNEHDRIRSLPAKERMDAENAQAARHVRKIVEIMHNGVNWDKDRRLIVRVDYTDKGLNVRSVVTNKPQGWPEMIYENDYCKRSRIEMFIKENKSYCRVPLSCQEFTANQFRFVLQGLGYQLLHLMRLELPLDKQNTSVATVRKALLLIPVLITSTPRRLHWRLSSIHPCTPMLIRMARKLSNRAA
jgi:hypothetical protein